jgi:DNA-binding SARP family transcriptional activator/predicted ATPase
MSDTLSLRLLGKPEIKMDDKPVTGFISSKAQALLFYLAVTGTTHARESLAALLWGDMPAQQASKNLRNVLSNLRALVGEHIGISRYDVAFETAAPHWLDVELFLTALGDDASKQDIQNLHRAVELVQGDFLEGFYAGDTLGFEEWALGKRSLLNTLMVQALHTLVVKHLERQEYAAGIEYANRLTAIEPWREETHRHLMLLYARSRQRGAALAQYEICKRVLQKELAAEPLPETTALYERIFSAAAPPPHNLPPQLTPLIGRAQELAQIAAYFNDPGAQVITLVGPGGIGKTRLALHAAERCIDPESMLDAPFGDGVYLVPLADAAVMADDSRGALFQAVADTLGVELKGALPPQAQLLNYFRERSMLLLLDNFEHFVPEARALNDILRYAPHVRVIVTSRVRLNLKNEYLLEIGGLEYPTIPGLEPEALLDYSAVSLFVQCARRAQPHFALDRTNSADIARICELVQGAPLGIELAASWLRLLAPEEIRCEIESSMDFLVTTAQDAPERHRSLRAVFEHSWNLLSEAEQRMFRSLAVFRGGFDRVAAAQVAGASLPALAGLVDKSLLRRSAAGRYAIHELLHSYASEKLAEDPENAEVHDAHCSYYAELLARHQQQLQSEDVSGALTALGAERENVRAAWNWAVSHRRVHEMNQFMECL